MAKPRKPNEPNRASNLAGQTFGHLVVQARHQAGKNTVWLCRCDCGGAIAARSDKLKQGITRDCGCRLRARVSVRRDQNQQSRTYKTWIAMRHRCTNPNASGYEHYGGRGIAVCQRWLDSFENFLADMGERPEGMTLDRFPDVNGNYEPGNVRWATPTEQARNRRTTRFEAHEPTQIRWLASEGYPVVEIARHFGVNPATVRSITNGASWL